MTRTALIFTAVVLAGCASTQPQQEQVWRDLEGDQTVADLRRDSARCDYEMARMGVMAPQRHYPSRSTSAFGQAVDNLGSAMLQGPGPRVWESCMRAAGWQRLQ